MEQNSAINKFNRENPRLAGLIAVVLGGFCIYHWVICPIQAIQKHYQSIELSFPGAMAGVIVFICGLILLAAGPRVAHLLFPQPGEMPEAKRQKIIYILSAILVVVALVFYIYFERYLAKLGYS